MKGYYFIPKPAPNPAREGEEVPIPPESYEKAQRLVDEGYHQLSRKYRRVGKGEHYDEGVQELSRPDFAAFRELHPDIVSWAETKRLMDEAIRKYREKKRGSNGPDRRETDEPD